MNSIYCLDRGRVEKIEINLSVCLVEENIRK